jgi:hypothetical protein
LDVSDDDAPETLDSLLLYGLVENMFLHLPPGEPGLQQGRTFAKAIASSSGHPPRIIGASQLGTGTGIPIDLLQGVQPGEVIYLEKVELFRSGVLPVLLAAFGNRLQLTPNQLKIQSGWFDASSTWLAKLTRLADTIMSRKTKPIPYLLTRVGTAPNDDGYPIEMPNNPGWRFIAASDIVRVGDILATLSDLSVNDVLVIGEVDRLSPPIEAILVEVLTTGVYNLNIGPATGNRTVPLQVPPALIVGTTARPEQLSSKLLQAFHCHVDPDLTEAYEPSVQVALREISDSAARWNNYCEDRSNEFDLAKQDIVRRVWEWLDYHTGVEALKVVSDRAGGSLQAAFHLAYRIAKVDQKRLLPINEDLIESTSRVLFNGRELSEVDWLLLDWAMGLADATYGPKGILPEVRLIASTQLPMDPKRPFTNALDGFENVFPFTFNMPLAESQNEFSLLYELGPMLVIRSDPFRH